MNKRLRHRLAGGWLTIGLCVCLSASAARAGWYDTDWAYRNKITIDHTKVSTVSSGNLSSFPVLINRTDTDWRDTANGGEVEQSDGGDILFTASDGTTKLDHEIEYYDETTGELVAWVEAPTVNATSATEIYIYYGNDTGVADQWNIAATWNSNYKAVWHLDEDPTADPPSVTTYYYSSYNAGQAWVGTPHYMTDNNEATAAMDDSQGALHELTAHTLESGSHGSGTITKVELRYKGASDGGPDRASLTPVFSGTTDGDEHDPGDIFTTSLSWTPWIDITSDTNAPGTWSWSDVTNLDLDVISVDTDEAYVSKVQLRVTYTTGSTGLMDDSTSNTNDAASNGTMTAGDQVAGQVGGSVDFDAGDDYLNAPADASLNIAGDVTISGWFKVNSLFNSSSGTSQLIAEKYLDADYDVHIVLVGTDYTRSEPADGTLVVKIENGLGSEDYRYTWSNQASWTAGQWYYFTWTTDSANAANNKLYINGADNTNSSIGGTGSDAIDINFSAPVRLGGKDTDGQLSGEYFFDGTLDEFRVSSGARSADWIVTSYNNQNSPSTFYSVGSQEGQGPVVGPTAVGACKGADCDHNTVQGAIDAASPGDTITLHFNDDTEYAPARTDNNCYNEHIVVNVPNLTIQGESTSPISAACLGPSSGGDAVIKITASGVTLKNLEISGKANNGSDGLNGSGGGGRSSGYGILIEGNDVDDVVIENCTVSFSYLENIRWDGDQDNDNNGNVTIRNCYLHHSDLPRQNIRIIGGSASGDPHVIENNLITTGDGIFSDAEYITVRKNIISGYPYWGHLANNGSYPETHDYNSQQDNFGGGWRYFSRCSAGIHIQNGGAGTDINVNNNLIVGTRLGIRVQTTGTIANNTVVNPFNPGNGYTDASGVRDATFGIMLVSGFSGTVRNNIVVVTEDNRATGQPAQASAPKYTTGITGTGVGFFGGSGSLTAGAAIANNNVWGFVDTDGSTATNWGGGLETCEDNSDSKCSNNVSRDPLFAGDTSDETNDGVGGCDSDAADSRCYELYHDNYFLKTDRAGGSCHADIRPNTAAYVGFVDMTSSSDVAGLGTCSAAADSGTPSALIDFGGGAVSSEPGNDGAFPNLGAFGNTDRASQAPTLRIVGIDVGDGGIKGGDSSYSGPGIIQPRDGGLTEVNVYFNRAVTAGSNSFKILNHCSGETLTAPVFDFTGATSPPFKVNMTWPADTFEDQWVRIVVLADDAVNKIIDYQAEALDGEISNMQTGTVPSGNGTAGGDAEFVIASVVGDIDGDLTVEGQSGQHDYDAITGYSGYPAGSCTSCPEDADGDGDVDANDLAVVTANDTGNLPSPGIGSQWYDSNWTYRKKITIDYTKVSTVSSTDLSDFPVLFSVTDADLKDSTNSGQVGQSDGGDILFTACDGSTRLDHELAYYNPATGQVIAWVEVAVGAAEDTPIYIYYGNAAAADQWDINGTWDSSYQAVWHLDEPGPDNLEYDTSNGQYPDILHIGGDIYAVAYAGNGADGYLKTMDIGSDGTINSTVDTLEFDTTAGGYPSILNVSGDMYAIAYSGDGDDGFLKTVDIASDGTIGSVVDTLEFDTTKALTLDMTHVSGDIYAIAYEGDGNDGYLKTVDIAANGTIGSVVDTLEFDIVQGKVPSIMAVSGDIYAIAYGGDGDDGFLKTVDIASNGTIGSVVDTLEFDTAKCVSLDMVHVSGTMYAIAYEGDGNDGFLKTVNIAANGTIAGVVDTLEFDTVGGLFPAIVAVSGNIYAIAYSDNSSLGTLKAVDIATNGTINGVVSTWQYDSTLALTQGMASGSGDQFVIAYEGDGSDGYLQTCRIDSAGVINAFVDSSAGGNDGSSAAASASGQVDQAQSFDGAESFGTVAADASINASGKSALSAEAWIYVATDGENNEGRIFDKSDDTNVSNGNGYAFFVSDEGGGTVRLQAQVKCDSTAARVETSTTLTTNAWHHVAMIYNEDSAKRIKIYIDGALATLGTDVAGTGSVSNDSAIDLRIGQYSDLSRTFDGEVDELRISSTARSADWMVTSYNNQKTPGTFYTVGSEETE